MKHLIPPYVAGTLSQDEKKLVDHELKTSDELRQELSFWLHARVATESHFEYLQEGHVASETITAYAEGTIKSESERETVEQHLNQCTSCSDEVALVRKTILPVASEVQRPNQKEVTSLFERLFGQLFKPVIAVPVGIIAVIFFVIIINRQLEQIGRSVSVTLEYQSVPRGNNGNRLPELNLSQDVTMVEATLIVPEPSQASWYSVQLVPPSGVAIPLIDTLKNYSNEGGSVRLKIEIPVRNFTQSNEKYTITVQELSSTPEEQFSGEMYEMQFRAVRK
ncbi:MAG: zf-HC2 domain-containing protein [Ignavibacteriae bacterium]|nr:zf-HC2 domain-containing protein [Ignavibacteriota bacterium]